MYLLDEEDYPSLQEFKQVCQKLGKVQERAMETMEKLLQEYLRIKEKEKRKKLGDEMVKLEVVFSEAHDKAQEYLDNQKDELSSLAADASENTDATQKCGKANSRGSIKVGTRCRSF